MPRKRKDPIDAARAKAAASMAAFVGKSKPKPKKSAGVRRSRVDAAMERVQQRIEADSWDDADAETFVALFAWLHGEVYGVSPVDEMRTQWRGACSAARKMFADVFDSDPNLMLDFIRWVWNRETQIEAWRRKNQTHGKRIGWRLQFASRTLITDYQIDLARKHGPK
jgi:hypothetical protein